MVSTFCRGGKHLDMLKAEEILRNKGKIILCNIYNPKDLYCGSVYDT